MTDSLNDMSDVMGQLESEGITSFEDVDKLASGGGPSPAEDRRETGEPVEIEKLVKETVDAERKRSTDEVEKQRLREDSEQLRRLRESLKGDNHAYLEEVARERGTTPRQLLIDLNEAIIAKKKQVDNPLTEAEKKIQELNARLDKKEAQERAAQEKAAREQTVASLSKELSGSGKYAVLDALGLSSYVELALSQRKGQDGDDTAVVTAALDKYESTMLNDLKKLTANPKVREILGLAKTAQADPTSIGSDDADDTETDSSPSPIVEASGEVDYGELSQQELIDQMVREYG